MILPSAYPSLMYLLTKFSIPSAKDSTLRVTYKTERGAIFRWKWLVWQACLCDLDPVVASSFSPVLSNLCEWYEGWVFWWCCLQYKSGKSVRIFADKFENCLCLSAFTCESFGLGTRISMRMATSYLRTPSANTVRAFSVPFRLDFEKI